MQQGWATKTDMRLSNRSNSLGQRFDSCNAEYKRFRTYRKNHSPKIGELVRSLNILLCVGRKTQVQPNSAGRLFRHFSANKSNMTDKSKKTLTTSTQPENEVQKEADALWESGVLGADAIEQIGKEHWRTPYLA